MIQVTLKAPNGTYLRLDTPDPSMLGIWLAAIFADFKHDPGGIPAIFTLEVR